MPLPTTIQQINTQPYQVPADPHTYRLTVHAPTGLVEVHVPLCARTRRFISTQWADATKDDLYDHPVQMCGCIPHLVAHVRLPDGTRRYRPIGNHHARFGVATTDGAAWRIDRWADTRDDADQAAAEARRRGRRQAEVIQVTYSAR